ncbi:MAG: outer membrane protein assembly factor BamB family protein [Planctomycetota bacterium]|jgi:outer membrane protein assembly factor BamB
MKTIRVGKIKVWMEFILITVIICGAAVGADWPHWRGPNYNGISEETGWNTTWGKDGPKQLWKTSVGTGFSSISVSKGQVYTIGNTDDKDTVYCLDADTGKILWKHSYPEPIDPKHYEGGPNATPTVDGGKVYTFSKTGKVFCLDTKNGDVIWQVDLQKKFGVKSPKWGLSGSVFIQDNMAILNAGELGIALNKNDGSLIWQNGKDGAAYATPVPFTAGKGKCIAVFNANGVACLRTATGKRVWQFPWKTKHDVNAADPIISGNEIFVSSGYGTGCGLFKIEGNKATEIWRNRNMRNHFSSCVLWQGYLYGFDGQGSKGKLTCLDYKSGEVKWVQDDLGTGSLTMAEGKLIILGGKGKLVVAEATPAGFKEISSTEVLTGRCWTPPVLANGKIYARNAVGDLVCLD